MLVYHRFCSVNSAKCRFSHAFYSSGTSSETRAKVGNIRRREKSLVFFSSQIAKHGRNGNLREAELVFSRMPKKDTISWTAMLTAYAQNGEIGKARKMFDKMPERSIASYNAMITAYVKNNCRIDDAFELFSRIPERNAVSYGAMVSGFVQAGMFDKAEKLYMETPIEFRDPVCSSTLINGYLKLGRLEDAVRMFDGMVDRDVVSWSSMVDGYCKAGRIVDARDLFDRMPDRNVVTWTSMINGYIKDGNFEEGFGLFLQMRREEKVDANPTTLSVMFDACGSFSRYKEGIQVHGLVTRMGLNSEVFLDNSIVIMYCRFDCMDAAASMFHAMSKKDAISWNSLIVGYLQYGDIEEALKVYERAPKNDVVSWKTMISGLFSKGLSEKAIQLFGMRPKKDTVSWTSVISGFVKNEDYENAFCWFTEMLHESIRVTRLTLSSMLGASAGLTTLNQGLQIHALVVKMNMEYDLSIQNSLVSMYSNCGDVPSAWKIFISISSPNIVSFNSMITGFAQNGHGKEALDLCKKIQNEGCQPNEITFLGILSACVHVGLVEQGLKYFKLMKSLNNIEARPGHYAYMVDLLGRAGLLDEAVELIHSVPFELHSGLWRALLRASRTHLRPDLAVLAGQKIIGLERNNSTPYLVLPNFLSDSGEKKEEQLDITKQLKGVRNSPGCSWIAVKDKVHLFFVGDQSQSEVEKIKVILWLLRTEIRQLH
ncbi:hypothetical protein L484_004126 [Morus notabilis]|uniref:Pentatricopeptide repeat-containing protein n=1 Tax=Morus notabilis TaxID=981085 RepID=W9SA66_9ROSA|nr:pentatricopeptide repeat-containing protein At1g53600, mitochondrial [Morus notabilis]XP_024029258.1 pentatricopeptide repeat-containing protein At1g53600, mitochondrial [Morus notabilis]EXC19411.1 hypothetical protein L484_004126 [Morus notabilis]